MFYVLRPLVVWKIGLDNRCKLLLQAAAAPVSIVSPPTQNLQADVVEKAKKAADLQARIAAQLRNAGLPQLAAAPDDTAPQYATPLHYSP